MLEIFTLFIVFFIFTKTNLEKFGYKTPFFRKKINRINKSFFEYLYFQICPLSHLNLCF